MKTENTNAIDQARCVRVREFAALKGFHEQTVRRWCREGIISLT